MTEDIQNEPASPETPETPETSDAPEASGSADTRVTAVDTGRRVDPSRLVSKPGVMRRKHDAGPKPRRAGSEGGEATEGEAEAAAPDAAPASADPGREKRRGPRSEGRREGRGRDDGARKGRHDRPRRDERPAGPRAPERTIDDATIAARERHTTFDTSGDFAALLEEAGPIGRLDVRVGDKLEATVADFGRETVFFDLGLGRDGWMPLAEVLDANGEPTVKVGETVTAFVVSTADGVELSRRIARGGVDLGLLEEAKESGIPVQGKVTGVNKGGLEVELGAGARGFCPIGQADLGFVEDPKSFEGKTLSFLVREIREGGRNVVLSRKALLERERKESAGKLLESLKVGDLRDGTVTRIQPFGAFVDLGGLDGLIPISELSWGHVKDPSEVVKEGDRVRVEVRKIEDDPKRPGQPRIGLSLRAAKGDPWDEHADALVAGATLEGSVSRLESFGAFVQLFEGVEGLIHISELSHERVRTAGDVVQPGEPVTVRVLDVDRERRRVSLSLREAREAARGKDGGAMTAAAPGRGKKVEGVVERIERYGVFVKLDDGPSALLPASETGTARGTDLGRAFPIGTRLSLLVIDVDDRGRVKVSKVAREQAEERAELDAYSRSQGSGAGSGFGTFADLLKGKLGK